jgi:hypothetical protein
MANVAEKNNKGFISGFLEMMRTLTLMGSDQLALSIIVHEYNRIGVLSVKGYASSRSGFEIILMRAPIIESPVFLNSGSAQPSAEPYGKSNGQASKHLISDWPTLPGCRGLLTLQVA